MGHLENKQFFGKQWVEDKSQRSKFDQDDLNSIMSIEVVAPKDSSYRCNSARIETYDGYCYYSLTLDSNDIPIGTKLDKSRCFICLFRRGSQVCEKLHYEKEDNNLPF